MNMRSLVGIMTLAVSLSGFVPLPKAKELTGPERA